MLLCSSHMTGSSEAEEDKDGTRVDAVSLGESLAGDPELEGDDVTRGHWHWQMWDHGSGGKTCMTLSNKKTMSWEMSTMS
jgi:hypothetical protein